MARVVTENVLETLSQPTPGSELSELWVEVLRRDTASSAIVATGTDAFGEEPWPSAQLGVFAFRHDWAEPLVERLEWQTSVARMAGGNESRLVVRAVPRRFITYAVGHAGRADALVADWLADNLGKIAWWPLPQYAAQLAQSAEAGASALVVSGDVQLEPASAGLQLTESGLQGWVGGERWVLIISHNSWQVAKVNSVANGLLWLAEPLARPAPAGSSVMPLVQGMAADPISLTQIVPGMAGGYVTAMITPAAPPDAAPGDPLLDGIPVWPDGNWRDDPEAAVEAAITLQDLSPAAPWIRRDDPWPRSAFKRRYLAKSRDEIETWRARLWRAQGRLNAFWAPDGLAPVLRVTSDATVDDGFLRVDREDISPWWHRPAACQIVHPDGYRQYALTATYYRDQGGVLVLRSGLEVAVPRGSRIIRLMRCRLDHDAVDFYWHSPTLMEIPLTLRQLPELS